MNPHTFNPLGAPRAGNFLFQRSRWSPSRAIVQLLWWRLVPVVDQSLSCVQLFAIPWTAAQQSSLPFIISQNLLKLMSTESVMPSNHLIFCCPLLLLSSVFPSIRVSSNESVLHIRWPKYWSFSFSISPSNEYSGPELFLYNEKSKTTSKNLSHLRPSSFTSYRKQSH